MEMLSVRFYPLFMNLDGRMRNEQILYVSSNDEK